MRDWSGRRLRRVMLYVFFAGGTVILAGSLSPERMVRERPAVPAESAVRAMTPELPQDRREAWARAAERDSATLLRLTCAGR